MNTLGIDIVVPVWNKPVETRNCLVSLGQYSPGARFILVDNGSDRETERLLEEFADGLGERALLLRNEKNNGLVWGVNRGLARAEAPLMAVVKNTSLVSPGWLEPLLELAACRPEAGLTVPRLTEHSVREEKLKRSLPPVQEASHGSFAAILIRKALYDRAGGFDEGLDGGLWCLKDYSRRALRAGYLTYACNSSKIRYTEEIQLGSIARREETLRRSISEFAARWGEERTYCIHFHQETGLRVMEQRLAVILRGARQGHRFTLLMPTRLMGQLEKAAVIPRHDNIRLEPLPLLFALTHGRKALARLARETPDIVCIAGSDGRPFPGLDGCLAFAQLEREVERNEAERYCREPI